MLKKVDRADAMETPEIVLHAPAERALAALAQLREAEG